MGYKKSVFRNLTMISQLGLCVLAPILVCVFAGNFIDSRFGTKTILVFVILGVLGGCSAAYRLAKHLIIMDEEEESREQEERISRILEERGDSVTVPKTPGRVRMPGSKAETVEDREEDL